jgi:large subunit ribosomal protein L24
MTIRKDDQVMVIAGKERGKQGKVLKIIPEKGRALVEKLNVVKRHVKPSRQNPRGGIIDKETSIAMSNLMVICPSCSQAIREKKRFLEDGRKARCCPKCDELLDH